MPCNGGNFVRKYPTCILKAVCIVVPSACIAAIPVSARSNSLAYSSTTTPYDKVFASDNWYMTFIKKGLPHPAFSVKIIFRGFIFSKVCWISDQLFDICFPQVWTISSSSLSFWLRFRTFELSSLSGISEGPE